MCDFQAEKMDRREKEDVRLAAKSGRQHEEQQLQLHSSYFCGGPGWRSLDEARGEQRKNVRRLELDDDFVLSSAS